MMEQGEMSFKSPSEWIWFWIMGNKKMCSFKRYLLENSITGLQQKYQTKPSNYYTPPITFLLKHP